MVAISLAKAESWLRDRLLLEDSDGVRNIHHIQATFIAYRSTEWRVFLKRPQLPRSAVQWLAAKANSQTVDACRAECLLDWARQEGLLPVSGFYSTIEVQEERLG